MTHDSPIDPITVTIPTAVAVSGLSPSALYLAMNRGELQTKKAGRKTLVIFADLRRLIAGLPDGKGACPANTARPTA